MFFFTTTFDLEQPEDKFGNITVVESQIKPFTS